MHRLYLFFFAPLLSVVGAAIRFCEYALAIFRPEPLAFVGSSPGVTMRLDGRSLDRTLQNDLRHEAGVPRRGAARNI